MADVETNVAGAPEEKEEKTVVSRNFIEQAIDKDLAEGVYDTVHTRFPPEPNGYLHIGHAKSILVNYGLAQEYGGKFNMRFDDTNPTKEDIEFVESIKEDVKWLGADYEDRLFFASNYFGQMYEAAVKLIKKGKAFVSNLTAEQIREYRGSFTEPGKEDPNRDRSVEENLRLFEEMKEGKYPALLRVPGAGVRPYGGDIWTAAQGAITLEIGIHGIPVTMEQKVYDDIFHGALNWYWEFYMDDRDKNYYKRVVLGCIRALDYIEEYTPWNGKEMGVTGSSQGGFLTLATAGLDKRITYYAPVHAALCDHTNSLKGVACGWPHYFYYNKGKGQEKQIEVSRYYDGINFARLITDKQKGWFSFGYNDDVVPPTTAWETYNIVKGPKEIVPYQATWHFWHQEQWDEWENWLLKQMNIK